MFHRSSKALKKWWRFIIILPLQHQLLPHLTIYTNLVQGGKNKFTISWAQWKIIMKSNISLLKIMSHKYMAISWERNTAACGIIIVVVAVKGTAQTFPLLWALTLYIQGTLHYWLLQKKKSYKLTIFTRPAQIDPPPLCIDALLTAFIQVLWIFLSSETNICHRLTAHCTTTFTFYNDAWWMAWGFRFNSYILNKAYCVQSQNPLQLPNMTMTQSSNIHGVSRFC